MSRHSIPDPPTVVSLLTPWMARLTRCAFIAEYQAGPLTVRLLSPIETRFIRLPAHPVIRNPRCPICRRGFTKRRNRTTCERCGLDVCWPCYWARVATPREYALYNAGGNDLRVAELLGYPEERTKAAEALLEKVWFLCHGCRS